MRLAISLPPIEHAPRDHLVLDLRRSLENSKHTRIPPVPLRWKLSAVSVSAEDLETFGGDALCHLRCECLGHARLQIAALAGVLHHAGVVGELPRRLDLRQSMGELVTDDLEFRDRLAELLALLRVPDRGVERRLRHAYRARRGLDASVLVGGHELVKALALLEAEQVLRGYLVVVERHVVRVHPLVSDGGDGIARE